MTVDFSRIEDKEALDNFHKIIGSSTREPDLIIGGDDGKPYLYRWWAIPFGLGAGVYAHYQVANDPARPLHDHPWDNMSTILAGGYNEALNTWPTAGMEFTSMYSRKKGDVIFRKADWAHRLILPKEIPGTLTLFATGPKIKKWGFWYRGVHHPYEEYVRIKDGASEYIGPHMEDTDVGYTV